MMKAYFRIIVVLAAAILSAAPAVAGPFNVNDSITYTLSNIVTAPGYGSGGLFTITDTNTHAVIQTFCLELNEYIYQNDRVAGISNAAVKGGVGGGSPDPISSSTDWLYAQYIHGIAPYNNPAALQIAFWILEEEVSLAQANTWWSGLSATFGGYVTDALTHNAGSYGTQVLNLRAATSENPHQSSLIQVPEPGILILLGISMASIVGLRRRWKE